MLNNIIFEKKNKWLQSEDCTVIDLVKYMRNNGQLRDTQIEAIETYLFLKIKGQNKPLWQLFSEGFFLNGTDLSKLNINQIARDYLSENKPAMALYDFARTKNGNGALLPELEKLIVDNPNSLDYETIIKSIFYYVDYADYLMSLPMGAGKTYLMAAFIYLDLYFAEKEPDNKHFAHNFLVLIPSGLKSSIVPSLKTILNFEPSWVLPEPFASNLKRQLKFDVLDEQKSSKKSNKAQNPNAQKVNACLPNPFGQVFVVNAEKVILNRVSDNPLDLQFTKDQEALYANELRVFIGKIPNLSILIDEVHHAATDDIKLRKVVNEWQKLGKITTVLGFSGTPYLQSPETIKAGNISFKFSLITNTVYYYPLVTAIKKFLKNPSVRIGYNLDRFQIIKQGIEDFNLLYKDKLYKNGTIPKIAIYCSSIEVLEEQVYPFLTGELQINPVEILKFHGGNSKYHIPKENELEFRSLDLPLSKKRYILLVQIGKEGWDCLSLTGVILSQKGDSPQNMVLQTSCRCLRQVDKPVNITDVSDETALIWLNNDNADTLNKQLKQEQKSSIDELNNLNRISNIEMVQRYSRMEYLELPEIDFYQMKVTYQSIETEETANTKAKLSDIIVNIENFKTNAQISTSDISNIDTGSLNIITESGAEIANYNQWIFDISRNSFGLITEKQLHHFDAELITLFEKITYKNNGLIYFNDLFDLYKIQSKIRIAFSIKRDLQTKQEVIEKNVQLLITENLKEVVNNRNLYPSEDDTQKILSMDESKMPLEINEEQLIQLYELQKNTIKGTPFEMMFPTFKEFLKGYDFSLPVKSKNVTFHYLPYNFGTSSSSNFEFEALQKTLQLSDLKNNELEIYYNGERGLTNFVIDCFAKEGRYWKNIGQYTTDFLIIKRKEKQKIYKALLVETKGKLYAEDKVFQKKKKYIETEFLKLNQEKFGFKRFDFLYLEGQMDLNNIAKISNKINEFFKD